MNKKGSPEIHSLGKKVKNSSIASKEKQLDFIKTSELSTSITESSHIILHEPQFNLKAQQENEEMLRKLEQASHQQEQKVHHLQRQLKAEKQRCIQERGKAEKAELQIKKVRNQLERTKYTLDQCKAKVFKYEEKNNNLKASIRDQSIRYKNLASTYQNQKIYNEAKKDFRNETLQKIIDFYQSINEGEIDPKKMNQFIQGQQHDIQILIQKLIEKEEAYNNKEKVLEQQRERDESQVAFHSSLCDKIEFNLSALNKEDHKLYEKCIEINSQNLRLQKDMEQLRKIVQRSNDSQKKIEEYVKKLEEIILLYFSEIEKAKAMQKTPKTGNEQKQLLYAKIAELQSQLKQAKSKINEFKEHESNYKRLERSHQQLSAQLSEYKAHNQKQAESIQQNLSDIEKYTTQLSKERENVEKLLAQIENAKSINTRNRFNQKLASSQILLQVKHAKDLIIEQIQAFQTKIIRKSEIVFREDKHHHSFGNYLTQSFPLLLLVQINQNTLFGAYSSYYLADGKSKDTFIFTFDKNCKLKTYFKFPGRQSSKSISYSDNALILGYNEVFLRNNSKSYEMGITTNIFGVRHYQLPSKLLEFEGIINNNKISYVNMEIHKIRY